MVTKFHDLFFVETMPILTRITETSILKIQKVSMISKIFKRVYNFLFFFSCSKNFMSSRLTPIPPLCETIIIQPKVMSVWIFMFLRGTNIILLFYFGFKKIKIKVFYPDLRCLFTASFSCPREHESGGSFMIIFIHERYHGLVLGLCVLC